jgi:predicted RNase H-like HicB family nuclease
MANYTLRIRPHYSGLFMGDCPEQPGLSVMGRDHDEVASLARQALAGGEAHALLDHTLASGAEDA